VPGPVDIDDAQIGFIRRLLHFGVIAESLPVAAEETLGLSREAALELVEKALTEDDLSVTFSTKPDPPVRPGS